MDEQPGGPVLGGELADEHLARDPPADPGADPRAPQHHRLHQQPPPGGAPRPAPQRARRRGAGPRPPRQHRARAAPRDRGGAQGRPPPRPGRDEQPRARHRHGRRRPRDPGREPHVGRPRPAAHRPGRPPGRRAEQGRDLPQVPRRPARDRRGRAAACTTAPIEQTTLPRNPLDVLAQQLVAMTLGERFTVDELLADRPPRGAVRDAHPRGARGRARHARRAPTRRDEFAELKPRDHLGPPDRRRRRPPGRPRRRRHQRRHDPGSRPVPGLPRGRGRHARPARRRARRGDGLRAARRDARRRRRARRELLADRGDHAQPRDRDARRRACPASCRSGRATPSAGRSSSGGRSARSSARPRRTWRRGRRAGRRRRRGCAGTTTSTTLAAENLLAYLEDEREATGALPTDRRIVVERFRDELGDWRLVILTPFGGRVHAPVDAWRSRRGLRSASGSRSRRSGRTTASRSGCPRATAALDGVEALLFPDPDEVEDLVVGRVGQSSLFASRFRENAARALLLPATPARDPDAALAAAPAGGGPARGRVALRQLPDPRRDVPRVPRRRLRPAARCARSSAASSGARSPSTRSRRRAPRRSRARCCSTTSPPTCTRATRRSPSAGRRR